LIENHIRLLGILLTAVGASTGVAALFCVLFFGGPAALAGYAGVNHVVAIVVVTAALVLMIPSIIAGLGLITLRGWARGIGIVLSILEMINVPFGTIVGVYGLIVLFSETADLIFTRRYGQPYVATKR
jgi:hypothetical protein